MSSGSVRVSVFGKTDQGRARDHNEDTFLVADLSTGNASLQPAVRSHEIGPRGSLFMVADGMGGAAAGELASAMAADLIYRHMITAWASDSTPNAARFAFRMKEAVELANERIHSYAREHPEVRGMGTTVTAAGVYGSDLYLTQIGDSRAYLVRDSEAIQLTKDQSLMQRLVDAGELTEDEAEQSERRNIILQALGPDPRVRVDLTRQSLRGGDTLILCSDGLSGLVRREEFAGLAREHADLAALCSALIDLANGRGGPDNITVVTARFEGEGLPEAHETDGVGYTTYQLPPGTGEHGADTTTETEPIQPRTSNSSSTLEHLRSLGFIVVILGVLLLLLAVWR
ncbi:MAG TPA: protein phosphatase 2C domain-containing protein [Gemmatimonadales bacterium]|nr:protein phosphatase 2C domain-containing protein [Gemmatimonadales bacterium]